MHEFSPRSNENISINPEPEIDYPAFDPDQAESERAKALNAAENSSPLGFEVRSYQDLDTYAELTDLPDVGPIPQELWRGERVYLDNIDQLGQRPLSTMKHAQTHNAHGLVYTARDKAYADHYAIGTDGVTFYDTELPKEQVPIGVIYKINNRDNHLEVQVADDDEPLPFGPFAGKFREFVAENIPASDYTVEDLYIMDDFVTPGGHQRSDFRRPLEVVHINDPEALPEAIAYIKARIDALDAIRNQSR